MIEHHTQQIKWGKLAGRGLISIQGHAGCQSLGAEQLCQVQLLSFSVLIIKIIMIIINKIIRIFSIINNISMLFVIILIISTIITNIFNYQIVLISNYEFYI